MAKIQHMQSIQNILTNVGHRVGHQSSLDESSERNMTTFLHGIAIRVFGVFTNA